MKGSQLVLKCYAQRKGDQWVAFCLDFDLAVQADSLPDVRIKMHDMIAEYVTDALVGDDQPYADELLGRRAPLYHYLKWYAFGVLMHARRTAGSIRDGIELFKETMPLKPV